MVGVPGRSKGCNTCIQRKIRCDQETPECGNCRKSKRRCAGYKRKVCYVFSKDMQYEAQEDVWDDARNAAVRQGRWRKTEVIKPHAQSRLAHATRVSRGLIEAYPYTTFLTAMATAEVPCSPHTMSAETAWRQQFHSLFLSDFFPADLLTARARAEADADPGAATAFFAGMSWLVDLQDLDVRSPALHSAVAALSVARVGRARGDAALLARARGLYAGALAKLGRALASAVDRLSDETLAACVTLSLYELTETPPGAKSAYMQHQRGALILLKMRGPDAIAASPLGHNIFLGVRSVAINASLVLRQDTFLSRSEWLKGPWAIRPKSIQDELTDNLFDILTILQHFDHLASSARTTQSTGPLECGLHDIIAKCHRIEATLVALYAKFEASVAGPLYWPELSTLACAIDNEECGKVFPVSFHFPSCLVGHILVAYWAVVMGVHAQLVFAHAGLAAIEPASCDLGHQSSHASLSAERRAKCIAAFRNICQSVEYMKRGGAGNFQSLALIPLLGSTLRCLGEVAPVECQREAMWATEFLHVMKRQLNLPEYNLMED